MDHRAGDQRRVGQAAADDDLRAGLQALGDGERAVSELLPHVGLSQSALSQHLAVLREEGLIAGRREGVSILYRIADPAALKVIAVLADIYCSPVQGH